MGSGRRYSDEAKLNYKKVFAVIIAIIVVIMAIIVIKNILTKAKNTKPLVKNNYVALYQDEKWGILGSNGEIVIEPMYQEMIIVVDKTKDIFLCTYDLDEENGTYKTKVINSKNEEMWTNYEKIEALENYDQAGNVWYEENVLKVQKDGKWGLIDLEGKELAPTIYDNIQTLKGLENSILVEKEGYIGLLNNKGAQIIDTQNTQILSLGEEYQNGYITVNQDNRYGVVSFSGEQILENQYEKIENIYSDKYFVIQENGKQQLIDKQGNKILTENFDEIKQIANSGIIFTRQGKYGFMNFEGNVIMEPTYDNLKEINTDIFLANKEGKAGVIDLEQNEKIAFNYQNIAYNKKAGIYIADDENYQSTLIDSNFEIRLLGILSEINTDSGYMKLKMEDDYKYYNFKFEERNIQDILKTNKIYTSKQNGKYGFVDSKGNVVVDYIYDDATELNEYGYAAVKKDGLWGAINSNGEIVIEPYYNLDNNLKIDFIGKWHLGLDLNMNYYCDK